ncbi:MAG: chemotaxis protein CheX [Deltaproteobacteria bacterium]|nr:chemotaxis protein CheX [Deltaproteobacteria bacterium]
MDVKYINPFLLATVNVLKTMAGVELTPGKPYLKKDALAAGDVSGIIGITGEITGSLSVSFPFSLIKKIMKNMLQEEITEITEDARDAVGEITNMICGNARRMLEENGINKLSAAIPTIIAGRNHTIKHAVPGPIIVIPFKEKSGTAVVEVSIKS